MSPSAGSSMFLRYKHLRSCSGVGAQNRKMAVSGAQNGKIENRKIAVSGSARNAKIETTVYSLCSQI